MTTPPRPCRTTWWPLWRPLRPATVEDVALTVGTIVRVTTSAGCGTAPPDHPRKSRAKIRSAPSWNTTWTERRHAGRIAASAVATTTTTLKTSRGRLQQRPESASNSRCTRARSIISTNRLTNKRSSAAGLSRSACRLPPHCPTDWLHYLCIIIRIMLCI